MRVTRGSRRVAHTAPVARSASARMERNFSIWNSAVRSACIRPTRSLAEDDRARAVQFDGERDQGP